MVKGNKKGYFMSWPGLIYKDVNHHLQTEDATLKGHMTMKKQSVKQKDISEKNGRHNKVMVKILGKKKSSQIKWANSQSN